MGHALAAQTETPPGVGPRWNLQYQRLVQAGDAGFTAGNGGEYINRYVNVQVISFALKGFIGQDVHEQIQISSRPIVVTRLTLTRQANTRTGADARWNNSLDAMPINF